MSNSIEFQKVELDWKPISIKDINELPHKTGVYQIYGTSPLYGTNTLLYIGMAENLHARLQAHENNSESFITRQPNRSLRYATVEERLVKIVEAILIVMHKPAFNSQNMIEIPEIAKKERYYIQNHGDRGMLNLEITNYYFCSNKLLESLKSEGINLS